MATDTIAAIATPPGRGGIGVIRVSGPAVKALTRAMIGRDLPPRMAVHAPFRDALGAHIDHGLALFFPAPHSYTGEDVLELHAHGGRVVLQALLSAAIAAGARQARPGEFTERAFLNDKLDLTQAEAVADLIDAGTLRAARSALRTLTGEYSRRVESMVARLTDLRIRVEASIDFPDDEPGAAAEERLHADLQTLLNDLLALELSARQGVVVNDGIALAIAGAPNVGKSSLLNRLLRMDRAIVSDIPGTTRDTVSETIEIDGIPVRLCDTAGLRDAPDTLEQEGIRRTVAAIANADVVLWVIDTDDLGAAAGAIAASNMQARATPIIVRNKIDLAGTAAHHSRHNGIQVVYLSALTGAGLDVLEAAIVAACGLQDAGETEFTARARHLQAFAAAADQLESLLHRMTEGQIRADLIAEDLRQTQRALEVITGRVDAEALLGEIFSRFCIGK